MFFCNERDWIPLVIDKDDNFWDFPFVFLYPQLFSTGSARKGNRNGASTGPFSDGLKDHFDSVVSPLKVNLFRLQYSKLTYVCFLPFSAEIK